MTLPNMNAAQRAAAEAVQASLKAYRLAAESAKSAAGDACTTIKAQMIIEQDANNVSAATRALAALGAATTLRGKADALVGLELTTHAAMSEALALTYADAYLVTNGTVNGPGAGRR